MSTLINTLNTDRPQDEVRIPPLRSDLIFTEAPDDDDGSPAWMLYDPVSSRFERVNWAHKEVLDRMKFEQPFNRLYESLKKYTTIDLTEQELAQAIKEFTAKNLTVSTLHKPVEQLVNEDKQRKVNIFVWLFHHYLYFRIPLIHPDNFLNSTYSFVRILASKFFILVYLTLTIIGLYFLSTRFDEYIHTFPRFYDITGAMVYGIGIACIKVIHEFSHAYVGKSQGIRVPTMGIAIIFLLPVPFCDVTDGWKLKSRRKRLLITVAGVFAELTIAGLSLFFWGISDSGIWQSLFFVLSSVSIVGTLLINLNPCMRYDGYYLLSDLMQIDNLQPRATSTTKWFYRKHLFGLNYKCPEERLTNRRLFLMFVYSISAWIYRLFLYTSIALMVYYAFDFKLFGVFLFILEIGFFLILPIVREIIMVLKNFPKCIKSWRFILLITILGIIGFWAGLPLSHVEKIPAILIPQLSQTVYISQPGVITYINIKKGDAVNKDDILVKTAFDELDGEISLSILNIEKIKEEIQLMSEDERSKALLPQKYQALSQSMEELKKQLNIKQQMIITSPVNGIVYSFDDTLHDGVYVYPQQEIAKVADPTQVKIVGYLQEYKLITIKPEQYGYYISDGSHTKFKVKITKINRVKSDYLKYPILSSFLGGEIAVINEKSGNFQMIDTYYEIEADIVDNGQKNMEYCFDQPGYIWINTEKYSLIDYGYNKIQAVINREWNL